MLRRPLSRKAETAERYWMKERDGGECGWWLQPCDWLLRVHRWTRKQQLLPAWRSNAHGPRNPICYFNCDRTLCEARENERDILNPHRRPQSSDHLQAGLRCAVCVFFWHFRVLLENRKICFSLTLHGQQPLTTLPSRVGSVLLTLFSITITSPFATFSTTFCRHLAARALHLLPTKARPPCRQNEPHSPPRSAPFSSGSSKNTKPKSTNSVSKPPTPSSKGSPTMEKLSP